MQSGSLDYNANENWLRGCRPASQVEWSNDRNRTEMTNVTISVRRIKALRRTVVLRWTGTHTHTQIRVQIGVHTLTCTQTNCTYVVCTHISIPTHTSTIITLHYIHLIKKWNSKVPNVLFLNKNAYRGLKRSALRTKSLFCFNHVWVLLLLNRDIHTYQENEDTKKSTDTSYSWGALNVANHMRVRACAYVRGHLYVLVCVNKPISV